MARSPRTRAEARSRRSTRRRRGRRGIVRKLLLALVALIALGASVPIYLAYADLVFAAVLYSVRRVVMPPWHSGLM